MATRQHGGASTKAVNNYFGAFDNDTLTDLCDDRIDATVPGLINNAIDPKLGTPGFMGGITAGTLEVNLHQASLIDNKTIFPHLTPPYSSFLTSVPQIGMSLMLVQHPHMSPGEKTMQWNHLLPVLTPADTPGMSLQLKRDSNNDVVYAWEPISLPVFFSLAPSSSTGSAPSGVTTPSNGIHKLADGAENGVETEMTFMELNTGGTSSSVTSNNGRVQIDQDGVYQINYGVHVYSDDKTLRGVHLYLYTGANLLPQKLAMTRHVAELDTLGGVDPTNAGTSSIAQHSDMNVTGSWQGYLTANTNLSIGYIVISDHNPAPGMSQVGVYPNRQEVRQTTTEFGGTFLNGFRISS